MKKEKTFLHKRTRMIVIATILLAFFAVFVGVATSYIQRFEKELADENQLHLSEVTSYISSHMSSVVDGTLESLKSIGSAVTAMDTPEARRKHLSDMAKQYSFAYIGYAGTDGKLIATVESENVDVSDEDYFIKAMNGESSVSNLKRKIFKDRGVSGILLSVPMGKGTPNGVLVAMMEISQLNNILSLESFDGNGYSYIFDKSGTIIMRSKSLAFNNLFDAWQNAEFAKGFSYDKFQQDVQQEKEGIIRYTYLESDKYAYYRPLSFNDWTVVNIVDAQVVSAIADSLTKELVLIGIAIVLSLTGLIFFTLRFYSVSQDSRRETDAKSAFLANMSHEIRTPMNAVVGMSEILLRDKTLTENQRNKVGSILNSGKGLLTIINDILDFSKIQSGKFSITDEPYEMESLLYDLTTIAAIRIGEKPVEFLVELDPKLPRSFVGDMGRVKQILLNIVGNAIKFTDRGSILLKLDGVKEGGRWQLKMEVRDSGIGIKSEDLQKLFESFSQVDSQRNKQIEGTGLGLAISQKLCEMMDGTITVTSEYGVGSSFVITIFQGAANTSVQTPALTKDCNLLFCEKSAILQNHLRSCMDKLSVKYEICTTTETFNIKAASSEYTHIFAHSDALNSLVLTNQIKSSQIIRILNLKEHYLLGAAPNSIYMPLFSIQLPYVVSNIPDEHIKDTPRLSINAIEKLPYVNVLVVDDNMVNVEVATGLMEPYSMKIVSVFSGKEAIEAVQSKSYDLVFMDHMMPEMSGIEALEKIRALGEEYNNIPIVALTANATSDARQMFLKNGFDDFLSKPIDTVSLDVILKKYLSKLNKKRALTQPKAEEQVHSTPQFIVAPLDTPSVEVDFRFGAEQLGSISTYVKILNTYSKSTRDRLPMLFQWFKTDHNRFIVEVHGLKSANATIGAQSLSVLAEQMETKCKANHFDSIDDAALQEFIQRSENALKEIETFLSQTKLGIAEPDVKEKSGLKHIAIVDDNPVNLELAESVLCNEYSLTKLSSGEKLIEFLKRTIPDMILLDIQMPGMDGYETLNAIRLNDTWKNIPVIFLTGESDISSEREGFRLGAKDFITKPFDNVVMLSRVRSQMELYEYQTELEEIVKSKTDEVENLQHVITVSWAEIIESRDGTTGSHVRHTTKYYEALLDALCEKAEYNKVISKDKIPDLLRASALHDIGKISISDTVLKKPGALTKDEFEYMKLHAKSGADMIQKIIDNTWPERFLLYAKDMALYHHERWDGTGYPVGLKNEQIPIYVQVLTIADVFDALTAVRPYKRAFTFDEALEIMINDRGRFYSPKLFDIFLENKEILHQMLDQRDDKPAET